MFKLWIDKRPLIWLFPFSLITFLSGTIWFIVVPFLIYFSELGAGTSEGKKLAVSAVSITSFVYCLYVTAGLLQLFVNEIYNKFIVRKVEQYVSKLEMYGYYTKRDSFDLSLVQAVEDYKIQKWGWFKPPWKNIATLFNRKTEPDLNYKLLLKDGREFYLTGYIENVSGLRDLLLRAGIDCN
ncbi:MAG: hypothetical protein OEZ33_07055 [Gammaproteobacteria bacterium]|nr:hypothetical protein [Gammaproteobacteria bacterium]